MRSRLAHTVFKGEFEPPIFTLDLAREDIGLAMDLVRQNDVPLPVANVVKQIMMQAMNRGGSERDWTIAIFLQEGLSGVEICIARVRRGQCTCSGLELAS